VNVEAFDNLKRVLRSVPPNELNMQNWNRCSIGHASEDVWFQEPPRYELRQRAPCLRHRDEVIDTINWFVGLAAEADAERHARRQALIDKMLAAASRAEKKARESVRALAAFFGI
jgi:hypothetical protein